MENCDKYNLRYYFGDEYRTVNQVEYIPGDECSGTPELYYVREVVETAPDLFGEEHLRGYGIKGVKYSRVPIFKSPVLVNSLGEVELLHAVNLNAVFVFGEGETRYRLVKGTYTNMARYKVVFRRLDKAPISEQEIITARRSKNIKVLNNAL